MQTRPCVCDNLPPPGKPYTAEFCRLCWHFHNTPAYRAAWGGSPSGVTRRRLCLHLGDETGETIHCPSCPNGTQGNERPVFGCDVHGKTMAWSVDPRADSAEHIRTCWKCPDAVPWPNETVTPIDAGRLRPGQNFNCSVIEHAGRRVFAYRQNWSRARIAIAELDSEWQPTVNYLPHFGPLESVLGKEDPRLFVFRGKLHCSFTAYNGVKTDVAYVRLADGSGGGGYGVEAGWSLNVTDRQNWEKNWVFFEHEGSQNSGRETELYAVYSVSPHVVLRVREGHTQRTHYTEWNPNVAPWHLRGGASPVRVIDNLDEYYVFCHARHPDNNGTYAMFVYTFEARPPFAVKRFCRRPLVEAFPGDRPDPSTATVIYPGGAVLANDIWRIACGYMDAGCRFVNIKRDVVERALKPVK